MVEVFFERVPILPKMLHKATFKANLALPPTHWKFPVSQSMSYDTESNRPVRCFMRYWPSPPITCLSRCWAPDNTSLPALHCAVYVIPNTTLSPNGFKTAFSLQVPSTLDTQ